MQWRALLTTLLLIAPLPAGAQGPDSAAARSRPFVAGGYDDKPHLAGLFGRIRIGGYVDVNGVWEREDGVTSELGLELTRWNLLAATELGPRVRVFSEVEIEHGGEEVTLELAQVDVLLVPAFNLRGGMVLLPLGLFNLTHDAPRSELPARPAAAEDLLGVALAQPGLGAFGRVDRGATRVTWELYAVNGYHDGILSGSADGTRLVAGRRNPDDANASPAVVGRVAWSPHVRVGLGLSGYRGAYNRFRVDGLAVDVRRDVAVAVADAEFPLGPVDVSGEAAYVDVEIPPSLAGIFAGRQAGFHVQVTAPLGTLGAPVPLRLAAAARVDVVDFDRDLPGDSMRSLTLGLGLRPVPEAVIKLAWVRGETRDRFDNRAPFARAQFALASYF